MDRVCRVKIAASPEVSQLRRSSSAAKGTDTFFRAAEYATLLKQVVDKDGTERERVVSNFIWDTAKEIATKGLEDFGPRVLGEAVWKVVAYPAGWVAAVTLDSEVTSRDPGEIIRDDRTSHQVHWIARRQGGAPG